jgi:alpha-1,2-mannosyltransferase
MAGPAAARNLVSRAFGGDRRLLAVVVALAFVVRLTPLLLGGGLDFYGRYDDGVYYSAADALSFGRVPYRDFVLLHPPGIMLVLTPFVVFGRLTSDAVGMATARLVFIAIGCLNTALVALIARRWGRPAMLVAGVMYAAWLPAVYAEQTTLLEVIGGLGVLLALFLLLRKDRAPTVRAELLAGVALGLAETMKIWYVAPWAAIVVWQLLIRRPKSALRVAGAGLAALLVVITPFALVARGRMYDMVVRDQLLRRPMSTSRWVRLPSILGVKTFAGGHDPATILVTFLAVVALLAAATMCWRDRSARPVVAVLGVNLAVLMESPVYFHHYSSFIAAPASLVVGIGLGRAVAVPRLRAAAPVMIGAAVLLLLGSALAVATTKSGSVFPGARFAGAAGAGCVASDDPGALIQMNRLSSDLRSGCPVAIDVTGITYDRLAERGRHGERVARLHNAAWQSYLYRYLTSARAFVIARRASDELAPWVVHRLDAYPVLAHGRGLSLRAGSGTASG